MNKYLRAACVVPFGILKMTCIKLFHFQQFQAPGFCMVSPLTEITLDYGGRLSIGSGFKMRDGAKLRVRKAAVCVVGRHVAVGSNCVIACRDSVRIGDHVQLSPNVQIYDHDHDFRHADGLRANHFQTAPVVIGDHVWIGANTVILRGSTIGSGSVVGAGCVIKGNYPADSVIIQKRESVVYQREELER